MDSPWGRLALDPAFQALFRHERLAARVREAHAKLLDVGGETDPGKLGELRGFLQAVNLIAALPGDLAHLEDKSTNGVTEDHKTPAQLRAESLAAGH